MSSPLRLVLVDDEPLARLRLRGLLAAPENPPNQVVGEVGRAEELLDLLARQPCDLVLLDIQLPGMSGYEVLRALRADERTRGIPVIAVSANAMSDDLAQAQAAGFDDYLTKPLDLARLLEAMARVLAVRA